MKKSNNDFPEMTTATYNIIVKLLKENVDVKYIKNLTGASIEEILKIKNKA